MADAPGVAVTFLFVLKMFLLTPGFQFALSLRLQEQLARIPLVGKALRRLLWYMTCILFSSEVAPSAEIGGGIYFPHPYAIVIGPCRIGRDVEIQQGVTIGRKQRESLDVPTIGDSCRIGAGAKILGTITIGANCVVGANAVVIKDVPPHSAAVGVPAKILPIDRPKPG